MTNRLHRSRSDAMLGGVCAGLGEYFGIDPTIVRLFFVVFTLVNGAGVLAYFVLWLVLPVEGGESADTFEDNVKVGADEIASRARAFGDDIRHIAIRRDERTGLLVGIAILLIGVVMLLRNLGVTWISWLNSNLVWPALLIVAGIWILLNRRGGDRDE
jgi:phage shock protein C